MNAPTKSAPKTKPIFLSKHLGIYDYIGDSMIRKGKWDYYVCADFIKEVYGICAVNIKAYLSNKPKRGYKEIKLNKLLSGHYNVFVDGKVIFDGESQYIFRNALKVIGRKKTFWLKIVEIED